MEEVIIQNLIKEALEARKVAYAPYSKFLVGAALLTNDHTVFTGSNIENVSYGATNCAERTAFFTAIHQQHREFKAIAIVGGSMEQEELKIISPCGICRQVMLEFCKPNFLIILAENETNYECYTLEQLMPKGFDSLH